MSKIDLIATKAMRYGGRALTPGDAFQATRQDARVLSAIKKAEPAPEPAPEGAQEDVNRQNLLDRLRSEYTEARGQAPDMRWGVPRLEQEIAAAPPAYQRRDVKPED